MYNTPVMANNNYYDYDSDIWPDGLCMHILMNCRNLHVIDVVTFQLIKTANNNMYRPWLHVSIVAIPYTGIIRNSYSIILSLISLVPRL